MTSLVNVSVIIPAHNEEKYVKRCIDSIKKSASHFKGKVEIIVVCNRCNDNTEKIALENGAKVVLDDSRSIARVRNAGIEAACGIAVITIDCDNRMTPGTICEVWRLLTSHKYIGGGAPIRFERYSFPLACNDFLCRVGFKVTGLYCGMMWAKRTTFEAINGFVDKKSMEDIATAKLLKKFGKERGKSYTTLKNNYLINSTRKFDDLGDWLYFKLMAKNSLSLLKAALGNTKDYDRLMDELFYDYNDIHSH